MTTKRATNPSQAIRISSGLLTVSQTLNVDVSGAADVSYYGNPAEVHDDISGAGSIPKK